MFKLTIATALSLAVTLPSTAGAVKTCKVDTEKRKLIATVLCGRAALEKEYHRSGEGCAKKSLKKRIEDSAIHIVMYRKCGDEKFS
jgi:hypothetical protein